MPSSSSKQTSHSSSTHGQSKSKHTHHRSSSGSSSSSSPPRHKVVIVLPPLVQPPVVVSSPSHRTAVPSAPALNARSRSIPTTQHTVKLVSSSPPRASHISKHPASLGVPSVDHSYRQQYPAGPSTGAVTLGYTITPVARSSSNHSYHGSRATITPITEDDYYDHPAVRAYEMQKAIEQARWHRRMQQEREQKQKLAQGQLASANGTSSYYAQSYQQRW